MDSETKIKSKQKLILIFSLGGFVVLLALGMYLSDPNRGKPDPMTVAAEKRKEVKKSFTSKQSDSVSDKEYWINKSEKRMTSGEKRMGSLEKQIADLVRQNERLMEDSRNPKKNTTFNPNGSLPPLPNGGSTPVNKGVNPLFPSVPKKFGDQASLTHKSITQSATKIVPRQPASKNNLEVDNGILFLDLDEELSGDKKGKHFSHYMPAGSFATAVLIMGVDAPTGGLAQTNPSPILLRIKDFGTLPNYFKSDISNCHVTGEAWGDISSERVFIRTNILSCILIDGEIIEVVIKGTISGEDGKGGMRGTLVSKQGGMIAYAALAGIASGLGDSVNQQYQSISTNPLGSVSTIDPDDALKSGLAQGFSNSMERVADFWIERANETYPIIEVSPHRIVELVLLEGVDFKQNIIGKTRQEQ
ncbi:MAG: TraB/VirB10 family protein [Methylococcales bacterium]